MGESTCRDPRLDHVLYKSLMVLFAALRTVPSLELTGLTVTYSYTLTTVLQHSVKTFTALWFAAKNSQCPKMLAPITYMECEMSVAPTLALIKQGCCWCCSVISPLIVSIFVPTYMQ